MRWLVVAAIACLPVRAHATRYTLEQLLGKVRSDYPGVVAAREALAGAEAQVSQANRLWWPTGEIDFVLTGSPEARCTDWLHDTQRNPNAIAETRSNAERLANCTETTAVDLQTGDVLKALPFSGVALRLDAKLTQPLYTFGKIEAARAAARAGRDAAHHAVDAARAEVALQVARAYWGLKWARAADATLADGRSKLGEWVDKIAAELDAGKSTYTRMDLARLKIALDGAELALLDVRRALRVALAGVRTLTGEPDADIDEAEIDIAPIAEHPISYYEDAARTHRPEARMLDAARSAVQAGRSLRLAELLPDFAVVGSFSYGYAQNVDNPPNGFWNRPNTLGAGLYLAVRIPLDIPERLARLTQARADERALAAKRREALGGIALEIERAFADTEEARLREERSAHGEKVARGWYTSVDQGLQLGVTESRDLVDAARSYFELRLKHLQSIMDVNVSAAQLARAAGLD